MRKFVLIIFTAIVVLGAFIFIQMRDGREQQKPQIIIEPTRQQQTEDVKETAIANPASQNCEEKGGKLDIVTNSDGSQFGMCQLENHSCEEWAFFRGECTVGEDASKIKDALDAKGLNLSGMKVVINKHLGKYIGGSVVPVEEPAGGGYVFAVKENGAVKVLADGNGVIMCSAFSEYPNFPSYLVSQCIGENGEIVKR